MFELDINIYNQYNGVINNKTPSVLFRFSPPCSGSYEVICNASGLLCGAIYDADQVNCVNSSYTKQKSLIRLASTLLRDNIYYLKLYTSKYCRDQITYTFYIHHIPTPKVSHFKYQWGMLNRATGVDINILPVWNYIYNSNIYVGVADTGVNYNHINLQKNIHTKLSYNFVHDDQEVYPEDECEDMYAATVGHGTHVSGIISGSPQADMGILGIVNTPNTVALKVLGSNRKNSPVFNKVSDAFVLAIEYAIKNNIKIINCSFSGRGFSEKEKKAMESAKDILFVIAAGNKGLDISKDFFYPASYNLQNSIVVAAVDRCGLLCDSSNYGEFVDIAAPGEDIASVYMKDQYIKAQGTSAATPFVTGVCALILEKNPKLQPYEIKQIITDPDNVTQIKGLKGKVKSAGILNAYKAVITDSTGLIEKS